MPVFFFTYQRSAVELTEERFGFHIPVCAMKSRVLGSFPASKDVFWSGLCDAFVQFWDIYYVLRGQLLCPK